MNGTLAPVRLLAAAASGLAIVSPDAALAQPGPYDGPWGMHYMWGTWGIGMALVMLLFWVLVIAALVYGVRWLATQGRSGEPERALDIAKRRYARGEITREQFEALKRDLE